VRYDERGCGMSDWQDGVLSLEQWAGDLGSVVEAARPEAPVTLLRISQGAGTCIQYALSHPERVGRMILYGGYVQGWRRCGTAESQAVYKAVVDLMRVAWGKDNPAFRQTFTSRFIPDGSPEQLQWFNDLCLKTTPGEVAARIQEARGDIDLTTDLGRVKVPTLVLHARDDQVIPVSEGRRLASGIPGAEFVELDSRNHILLEHEPAWQRFQDAMLAFLPPGQSRGDSVFAALSARERQVLALIADGLSNIDIAERLGISEKTVRNHSSNVFDKLGVWSRARAIVFARDHGFSG
jgi:pimeloyl-ACP methyl ester carboxylesterase/DNA-binding CsgD family transcriptional regulator